MSNLAIEGCASITRQCSPTQHLTYYRNFSGQLPSRADSLTITLSPPLRKSPRVLMEPTEATTQLQKGV